MLEFLAWCDRTNRKTLLLNPLPVLRWNTDKHYLSRSGAALVFAIVPTVFVEPDAEPLQALQAFLATEPAPEYVVKPTISAGARDTQRYSRARRNSPPETTSRACWSRTAAS